MNYADCIVSIWVDETFCVSVCLLTQEEEEVHNGIAEGRVQSTDIK